VTEVERFFRRLVSTLAASDPARLQGPVPLDDITGTILPYRTYRRALQFDTVEDYEAVLLRLCAGEGDLVWTEPEEARERFVEENRSANPDLTALYAFENVRVRVRPEPLLWALAPDPQTSPLREASEDREPEPEEPESEPDESLLELDSAGPEPSPAEEPLRNPGQEPRSVCRYCGGALPTGRKVNFCPHCGEDQTRILCSECRSEVEPGWRHCVNCGAAVGEA
jgi:hypothetical protein